MSIITRTQHVQYDTVSLLPVEGKGTTKFLVSGAPDLAKVKTIGAVFSGDVRITRLASGEGYNIVRIGKGTRNSDRRRVFFRGSAKVRLGDEVLTLDTYWNLLSFVERIGG